MRNLIRISMIISFFTICLAAMGQTFPTIWDLSNYDYNRGKNGYIRWINYDGIQPSTTNKAIIFGTSLKSTDTKPTDLLRLTTAGVATFNSPYPGYSMAIELRNQGVCDGRLKISGTMLDIEGASAVNIGTATNAYLFQVSNTNTNVKYELEVNDYSNKASIETRNGLGWIGTKTNTTLNIGVNSTPVITIGKDCKNVYIGLSQIEIQNIGSSVKGKYSLFVKKGILSEDYSIGPVSSWADFVFSPTYRLKPLSEVEEYIIQNKHLPDVPSEEGVSKDGYSQHELNKALLQKIEELTLYVIQQQKEIQELKSQIGK